MQKGDLKSQDLSWRVGRREEFSAYRLNPTQKTRCSQNGKKKDVISTF